MQSVSGGRSVFERDLTNKEKRFVQEYLIDLNATKASIRAGYSKKSAKQIGSENLSKPVIQKAIQEAIEQRSLRTYLSQDRVLLELSRIAFSDMKRFSVWGPSGIELRHSDELSDSDAACVAELSESVTEHGGSRRFKLHDKLKALELLGKHLGMFKPEEQSPQTINQAQFSINLSQDELAEAMKKARE